MGSQRLRFHRHTYGLSSVPLDEPCHPFLHGHRCDIHPFSPRKDETPQLQMRPHTVLEVPTEYAGETDHRRQRLTVSLLVLGSGRSAHPWLCVFRALLHAAEKVILILIRCHKWINQVH